MILDKHWWRTVDGRLVPDGDPDARFLAYPAKHEIPDRVAIQLGMLEPEPEPDESPAGEDAEPDVSEDSGEPENAPEAPADAPDEPAQPKQATRPSNKMAKAAPNKAG